MTRKQFIGTGNNGFTCIHCKRDVPPLTSGSYRNHCPFCLWSRHVDETAPGDRQATCEGMMEPVALEHSGKKGYIIIHRCTVCGIVRKNKAALSDPVPDCWELIISLSHPPEP